MKVNYLVNYNEDKRYSMNNYVDDLCKYQKEFTNFEINKFVPEIKSIYKIFPDIWTLRFSRFISYPKLIKKLPYFDVTHVIDHSYAHLVNNINSKVKILTVHDLIPLVFEGKIKNDLYDLNKKEIIKKKYLFRYSTKFFKYYDKIISVSQNTKKDILKFTDCPESKIHVMHLNIPQENFNTKTIDKNLICKKFKIPFNSKKILISGNGFYKNHITSIRVLEALLKKDHDVCLVWIGHKGELENIHNFKYINKIYKIPIIDKQDLPSIYKTCDILLFPSLYEGMGILPMEAMKIGIPVVTSNTSSIPEIVGDAAIQCDPRDVNEITKKIEHLLTNDNFYDQKVKDGLERSKKFDYDKMHKQIINLYKEELSKKI